MSGFAGGQSGGASVSPSNSVVSETSFGQAASAGASATYSRGDHTHGTPSNPLAGGLTTTVTLVCDVTCSGGVLTVKTRTLTFTNGLLTDSGSCA